MLIYIQDKIKTKNTIHFFSFASQMHTSPYLTIVARSGNAMFMQSLIKEEIAYSFLSC